MSTNVALEKQVESALTMPSALLDVLKRFNESTEKLETQHASLIREVEDLREQLRSKDEEMKRAERLAMLGETAAGLAHEIRNPLGAITLFVSMLKADLSDRPEAFDIVEQIEKSIKSLDGVVSNVLHFAKNQRIRCAPLNIHSVVQELVGHFSSLYSPQSTFEVSVRGNPFLYGDEQGIRQCLYNIVNNSLQATSYAGVIRISVSDTDEGEGIQIVVSDDGPGIPREILGKLFQPFTSGRREGTGLGLSIVRRIVDAHGGVISAQNTPSAEFSIVLPRKAQDVSVGE